MLIWIWIYITSKCFSYQNDILILWKVQQKCELLSIVDGGSNTLNFITTVVH